MRMAMTMYNPAHPGEILREYDLWHAAQKKRPKVEKFFRAA